MVRVELYTLFDQVVCVVHAIRQLPEGSKPSEQDWINLAYVSTVALSDDPDRDVEGVVSDALGLAGGVAREIGGWQALI